VLRKATAAPEWKDDLEKNHWANVFVAGDEFSKELDKDYTAMKTILQELGLAK
jgi:tripartite-type tricarboxylate transporter receptor subunit TctC